MICIYPEPGSMPTYRFRHGNRVREFEWHPYCGPALLNKRGDPLADQPDWFLRIASYWNRDGRPLDADGMADFGKVKEERGLR